MQFIFFSKIILFKFFLSPKFKLKKFASGFNNFLLPVEKLSKIECLILLSDNL